MRPPSSGIKNTIMKRMIPVLTGLLGFSRCTVYTVRSTASMGTKGWFRINAASGERTVRLAGTQLPLLISFPFTTTYIFILIIFFITISFIISPTLPSLNISSFHFSSRVRVDLSIAVSPSTFRTNCRSRHDHFSHNEHGGHISTGRDPLYLPIDFLLFAVFWISVDVH